MRRWWMGAALAGTLACGVGPGGDGRPPRLVGSELSADGGELSLEFDEPVVRAVASAGPRAEPAGGRKTGSDTPRVEGTKVKVRVPSGLVAGKDYRWTAEVDDAAANTTQVAGRFYGPNPHPAALRLNELRVAGSGPHPDFVELLVGVAGSLGGWTLEYREAAGKAQRLVLEDQEVAAGAVVLVYRKAPAPAPRPETAAEAVVLIWPEVDGFSAVRGALLLRPSPNGEPTDQLAWAATSGQGKDLVGGASATEVDPTASTATRTWCRTEEAGSPWLLVATGCATPGGPNKLKAWEGSPSTRRPPTSSKPKPQGRRRRWSAGPAGPWSRSGREPGADGEASAPATRAAGPRTSPPPGLRGSRVLPQEPRRRTRAHRWEPAPRAGADEAEAAVRRRDQRS